LKSALKTGFGTKITMFKLYLLNVKKRFG